MLKKINKKTFNKKLGERNFEDLSLINAIEKHFIDKRDYIFNMPNPGDSVILLYSGGLDSTVAWSYLIEKYKLHVYPLVISKTGNFGQKQSINYFKKYFKKRYGKYYHQPFIVNNSFLANKIRKQLTNLKKINSECLLDNLSETFNNLKLVVGLNALSPIVGITYIKYLESKYNLKIRTLFLAVLAGDGTVVPTQSFTYLRKTLLFLDNFFSSQDLQISSIFFEKELGIFCDKKEIIRLGAKHLKLPLEKTFSCYESKFLHCGYCLACYSRNLGFKKAKLVDKTLYYDKLFIVKKLKELNQLLIYKASKGKFLCKYIKHQILKKS